MTTRTAKGKNSPPRMTAHHYEYLVHILVDEIRFHDVIATKWNDPVNGEPLFRPLSPDEIIRLAKAFARGLKYTNPRFDTDTFVDAVKEKL